MPTHADDVKLCVLLHLIDQICKTADSMDRQTFLLIAKRTRLTTKYAYGPTEQLTRGNSAITTNTIRLSSVEEIDL